MFLSSLTLQQRIGLLVFMGLALGLGLFSWVGIQAINDSTLRILEERKTMAVMMASHLDVALTNMSLLLSKRADFGGGMPSEQQFRQSSRDVKGLLLEMGIATRGMYLLDDRGFVILVDPHQPGVVGTPLPVYEEIGSALHLGLPTISSLADAPATGRAVAFAAVPIFDAVGNPVGALAAAIDVSGSIIDGFIKPITLGETGYSELIDKNGIVLARTERGRPPEPFEMSDHPERFSTLVAQRDATVGVCHRCHGPEDRPERTEDVFAFAPLTAASWGVMVRQSEEEAFAIAAQLKTRLVLLGGIVVASVFLLLWFVMQGVVRPIKVLTDASARVAAGNFDAVPRLRRRDEIGRLCDALVAMALDLARVQKELVVSNQELLALNSVAAAVGQSLELEEVLGLALEKVLEVTGEEAGSIFIADEKGERLKLASVAGYPSLFLCPQAASTEATCACHQVLSLGYPLVVNDVSQCPGLREKAEVIGREVCFASVPIRSKVKALGVINVACSGGSCFTEVNFRLLDSIGRQVGLAVENSLLYRETKRVEELRGQLLNAIISAQEDERRRLSRELHDGAGQALTGLILGIESAESLASPTEARIRKKLGHARLIAVSILEDMRRLMQDLRSTLLDDLGLVAALRSYAQSRLEGVGVTVDFQAEGSSHRLPALVETSLFRIAQESVHNIAKHAGARTVTIRLQRDGNMVRMAVEDDGRGFDVDGFFSSDARQHSLGLVGMQERASLMGGAFHISSRKGQGTSIIVEVTVDTLAAGRT
jgi:signal transduction histidine kinase